MGFEVKIMVGLLVFGFAVYLMGQVCYEDFVYQDYAEDRLSQMLRKK